MLQPPYPLKGHCPRCGPDRNADIIKQHHEDYSDEESNHWGYIDHRILRCRGCERIFFQIAEYHTEEGGEIQPLAHARKASKTELDIHVFTEERRGLLSAI